MGPVALLSGGIVCGLLGAADPRLGGLWVRPAIGVAIGVAAAAMLPLPRAALQI